MIAVKFMDDLSSGPVDKLTNKKTDSKVVSLNDDSISNKNEKLKVLIVDDDVDVAESISDLIGMQDDIFNIKTAYSLDQAKSIAFEFSPDIAFLDIKLGKDNGLDLLSWLKISNEDIFCIMMTAFREADYSVTAVKNGADDYLHKPIIPEKLLSSLSQASKRQRIVADKKRSEKRFRAMFEQTFQWLFLTDKSGVLLEVNQVALDFIKLEYDDVVGKMINYAPWWNSSQILQEKIKKMIVDVKEGQFIRDEIQLKSDSHEYIVFDISIKPILGIDNIVDLILIEMRDITERKQAELNLIDAKNNLENEVAKRTEELQKAMLKAEQASNAKSDFISRMSHELRTPMNAVLGFAQLMNLDSELLSERHQQNLNEIMTAGQHLLDLINEILEISAIESGTLELAIETVDLMDVIAECTVLVSQQANDKNIIITNNVTNVIEVIANFMRLKQVFINLLSNAVKYNTQNGTITIDAISTNDKIRILVRDTGIGLKEDNFNKVFQPFERLHYDPAIEGAGIGLVISKKLIELMDGTIGFKSEYGVGSEFWIELNQLNDI